MSTVVAAVLLGVTTVGLVVAVVAAPVVVLVALASARLQRLRRG